MSSPVVLSLDTSHARSGFASTGRSPPTRSVSTPATGTSSRTAVPSYQVRLFAAMLAGASSMYTASWPDAFAVVRPTRPAIRVRFDSPC